MVKGDEKRLEEKIKNNRMRGKTMSPCGQGLRL
jgi:hypothetical protein